MGHLPSTWTIGPDRASQPDGPLQAAAHPIRGRTELDGLNHGGHDEEYLTILRILFAAIYASPGLSGFCYTQITDTQQEKNGLYDEYRKPKLPIEALRDIIWQPSDAVPTEYLDIAQRKAIALSKGAK